MAPEHIPDLHVVDQIDDQHMPHKGSMAMKTTHLGLQNCKPGTSQPQPMAVPQMVPPCWGTGKDVGHMPGTPPSDPSAPGGANH